MTTSRGCPFKCSYCSANILNEGRKIWVREYEVAYNEIKRRFEQGIREFCFYEDNLLLGRDNFKQLCRLIRDDRDLKGSNCTHQRASKSAYCMKTLSN